MTLSVLITYHNERAWLTQCLESLLAQPHQPDEIIICDDASSIPPSAFIPPHAQHIRVLRNETNLGPARSRNRLLRQAASGFIHFHDADDWFEPGWAAAVGTEIENGADVVVTDRVVSDDSGVIRTHALELDALGEPVIHLAIRGSILPACMTYRRDLALQLGGFREDLWQSEDYHFHVRLLAASRKTAVIAEDLVHVRHHGGNRSRAVVAVWQDALNAIRHLERELPASLHGDLAMKAFIAAQLLARESGYANARAAYETAKRLNGGGLPYDRGWLRAVSRVVPAVTLERLLAMTRKLRGAAP